MLNQIRHYGHYSIMLALLVLLQGSLWSADSGILKAIAKRSERAQLMRSIAKTNASNQRLIADIRALKSGGDAIGERAREELALIGAGEHYFQY